MILEQKLEQQIVDAVRADGLDGVYYSGAWDEALAGDVKGDEGDAVAVVSVTVSPRQMADYGGGVDFVEADIPVTISCSVGGDTDPTGTTLLALYTRAAEKVWSWVKCVTAEQDSDLTVVVDEDEIFSPGGVMQSSGKPPTCVRGVWSWEISFVVKGIIKE